MDLRDQFAVRFAGALVGALTDPALIAQRAYELAEAMLAERARLVDLDEQRAIAQEADAPPDATAFEPHPALLDEPAPFEEADNDEPPYDPTWDLEPAGKSDAIGSAAVSPERSGP